MQLKVRPSVSRRLECRKPLNYPFRDIVIPEASSCILRNNFTLRFKLGWSSKLHGEKSLEGTSFYNAYSYNRKQWYWMSSLHIINWFDSWIRCGVLGPLQGGTDKCVRPGAKAAKFAHYRNYSNSETMVHSRKIARICVLYKGYTGERAWKAIGDR
jgi:hypothetical protein